MGVTINTYDLMWEDYYGSWPFNIRPMKCVLTILQSLYFIPVTFGILGALRSKRNFYFLCAMLLFAIAVIFGIFGVISLHASRTHAMEDKVISTLEKGQDADFVWIDRIQLRVSA